MSCIEKDRLIKPSRIQLQWQLKHVQGPQALTAIHLPQNLNLTKKNEIKEKY